MFYPTQQKTASLINKQSICAGYRKNNKNNQTTKVTLQDDNISDDKTVVTTNTVETVTTITSYQKKILVEIKVPFCEHYDDNIDCMNEEIELIVDLICKWIEGTNIAGVIGFDNELKTENFEDLIDWINEPRVLGKRDKKV